jgi:hypothetical protein
MAKHGKRTMKEFSSAVHNQFGMRIVILAAYVDEDGDSAITLWV